MFMSRLFTRCFGLTGLLIGLTSLAVRAESLEGYGSAKERATIDKKILFVVLADKPYDFPKEEQLKKVLDNNVVITLDPKYEIGDGQTFGSYLNLSAEEIKNGVLISADYRDKNSVNYDKAVLLKNIRNQSVDSIKVFCGILTEAQIQIQKLGLSETEKELIRLTNEYRAQHGRAALEVSPELMKAARQYVVTPTNTKNGHATSANISRQSGYPGMSMDILGWGQSSAQDAINCWKQSKGHDQYLKGLIIMNNSLQEGGYTKIGASGSPGGQWVIYFGN
jgi:hypothetical protein